MITRHADVVRVARDHGDLLVRDRARARRRRRHDHRGPARGIGPGVMLNMCDPPTAHADPRAGEPRLHAEGRCAQLEPFLRRRAPRAILDDASAARRRRATSSSTSPPSCRCRRSRRSIGVPAGGPPPALRVDVDDPRLPRPRARRARPTSSPSRRRSACAMLRRRAPSPRSARGRADDMLVAGGRRRALRRGAAARSSACCSPPAARRRATRSPAGSLALIEHPGAVERAARRPRAAPARGRGDPALDERDRLQPPHRDARRRARRPARSAPARR